MERDEAQLIILTGFIATIALVAITLMLSDIIYSSNSASIETIQSTKFNTEEILKLVQNEIKFAHTVDADVTGFGQHMTNFSQNLSKIFAARGISVTLDWSGVTYSGSIVSSGDRIAYCGNYDKGLATSGGACVGVLCWLREVGLSYTDYSVSQKCEAATGTEPTVNPLVTSLCSDANCGPSSTLNITAAIFEFDDLQVTPSGTSGCVPGGSKVMNLTQCKTLQNWTNKGGKLVKVGAVSTGTNQTLLDLFTRPFNSGTNLSGGSVSGAATEMVRETGAESEGYVAPWISGQISKLLKNVQVGYFIDFGDDGYLLRPNTAPSATAGIAAAGVCKTGDQTGSGTSMTCTGTSPYRSIALNWTYGSGEVFHFPRVKGEVSLNGTNIINDPEDLRPILNLIPPGGACSTILQIRDAATSYNATVNC